MILLIQAQLLLIIIALGYTGVKLYNLTDQISSISNTASLVELSKNDLKSKLDEVKEACNLAFDPIKNNRPKIFKDMLEGNVK
jgi:hypothetical protein